MGFRYRKRIKIAPGININLSKSGISTSLGRAGATINISKRGVRTTVGLPGTGLSYSELHASSKEIDSTSNNSDLDDCNIFPSGGGESLNICKSCVCIYPSPRVKCPSCGCFSKAEKYKKYKQKISLKIIVLALIFCFIELPVSAILMILLFAFLIQCGINKRAALRNGGYHFSSKSRNVMKKNGRVWIPPKKDIHPLKDKAFEPEHAANSLYDFSSNLAVVWAEECIIIEFSYRNPGGDTTRRKLVLSEVLVNDSMEPYLKGFCCLANDHRLFKFNRISSKVLLNGVKYHKDEFLEDILCLPRDEFSF